MSDRAERVVAELFEAFRDDFERLPADYARRAREAGESAGAVESARVVADYIAGMTVRFALQLHDGLASR